MKNKIKVGITTWVGNLSLNYGSILQAAAMQKLIQDCGCNPITIDFYHYHSMPKNALFSFLNNYIDMESII